MTNANDGIKGTHSVSMTSPPLQPANITVRFALSETQIDAAYITYDKLIFATFAKCLGDQLLKQIGGDTTDPPATGLYAKLNAGIIRVLTDSDSNRV